MKLISTGLATAVALLSATQLTFAASTLARGFIDGQAVFAGAAQIEAAKAQ